jgi:hypothetical protein
MKYAVDQIKIIINIMTGEKFSCPSPKELPNKYNKDNDPSVI